MRAKGFRDLLATVVGLSFIGSAAVVQAQDAELPFTPVLTIGNTTLVNDQVFENADGSFSMLGNQQGGGVAGQPVWDLTWDLVMNQDPLIGGSLTLTNLSTTTRSFNIQFLLPVTPALSASVFGGMIRATLVDFNRNGSAALAPIGVSPSIFRGTIDGVNVLSLLAANLGCFGSGAGCMAIGMDEDGLPGPNPTISGPAVNSAIGIFLNFSLSPGDRVTINTTFMVESPSAVPVPAALPLLLSGLGALVLRRRRLTRTN